MTGSLPASINVQPHPRLLSVLGDIEFSPWQCIAELVDNAFDEFLRHPIPDDEPTVWVTLPVRNSSPRDSEVWVKDNGPGMSLAQLNNALRAGWTSNDRFGQLGLFGVGFNIATARLGQVAIVRTARVDDPHWTVVTVDLKALAAGTDFDLPVTTEPKSSTSEHGTEIVIRSLKPEHHQTISRGQAKITDCRGRDKSCDDREDEDGRGVLDRALDFGGYSRFENEQGQKHINEYRGVNRQLGKEIYCNVDGPVKTEMTGDCRQCADTNTKSSK